MKKNIVAAVLTLIVVLSMPLSVFAHGHGSGHRFSSSRRTAYPSCTVENCNTLGNHTHDGATYCGHYIGDGHDYHVLCDIANCTQNGTHIHDGVTYMPHSARDGHSYHTYNSSNSSRTGTRRHSGCYYPQ